MPGPVPTVRRRTKQILCPAGGQAGGGSREARKGRLDWGMCSRQGTRRCPPPAMGRGHPGSGGTCGRGPEVPSPRGRRGPAGRAARAGLGLRPGGRAPPPLPRRRLTWSQERGRGAAARRRGPSRGRAGPVAATATAAAAARREAQAEEEAAEEGGGGRRPRGRPAPAGGGHDQRPHRERLAGAGERGEAEAPAGGMRRAPGGRAGAGTQPAAAARCPPRPPPGAPFLPTSRAARAPRSPAPSGASLWGGAFPPARGSGGQGAKPHLPSWSPLFCSRAIGRPGLKRKGGARGEIRVLG